ncbi:hypothetical protein COO60DRAFT_1187605 [Scenedesmus sp. NREL 46B-D3]|nr:hypothetical protein COO60DRAFT_1187605 [Scenedesmus sp. NREL 46B-D3]
MTHSLYEAFIKPTVWFMTWCAPTCWLGCSLIMRLGSGVLFWEPLSELLRFWCACCFSSRQNTTAAAATAAAEQL